MPASPTRQALLLTDVVDSTALVERLGDVAVSEVWARHDQVARALLDAHGGREIDKTDGFLLLFEHAAQAVRYGLAYHRALATLSDDLGVVLRARAGLHVGDVVLRENAPADVARGAKPLEVEGLAKPVAARIMSVAPGGQILLSGATADALRGTDLEVVSHGHWRMKGVAEPIELFGVRDDQAPAEPPADGEKVYQVTSLDGLWMPVREVPHHLPRELDAFVGRDADLRALQQRVESGAALVSVLGIGGTGKTRLALRYGRMWLGDWPGGVWFCDLSEARSVEGICFAVGDALGVPLGPDPVATLADAIAGRGRTLVILDNFEQVARHAADTLGVWLQRAVDACFLVTTREVLGLPGEEALALPPLDDATAVALFERRAASAKRGFVVTDNDRPHVEALVRLLDRLPLAIELAAARVRMMAPAVLVERMDQRFRLLTSRGQRRDRQATLRGALDWSWDLLDEWEKAALAQLSVFEGGWSLDAAEAVLDLDAWPDAWPLDVMQALVDKSLVRFVDDQRYDLLVSVQAYAAEHLDDDARRAADVRHGCHYADLEGTRTRRMNRAGGAEVRDEVRLDIQNIVAACRRAVARRDAEIAAGAAQLAREILYMQGPVSTAVELAESALGLPIASATLEVRLRLSHSMSLALRGRTAEALVQAEQACALAAEVPDALVLRSGAEATRARALVFAGRAAEAVVVAEAAVALGEAGGDDPTLGHALDCLNHALGGVGDIERATAAAERAVAVSGDTPEHRRCGLLNNLATLYQSAGQVRRALGLFEQALEQAKAGGNRRYEANIALNIATIHQLAGRLDDALTSARAAREHALHLGTRPQAALCDLLVSFCLLQMGNDDWEPRARASVAVLEDAGHTFLLVQARAFLGTALLEVGRVDEGRALLAEALSGSEGMAHRAIAAHAHVALGAAALADGALDAVRTHVEQARAMMTTAEQEVYVWSLRARLEAAEGNHEAAADALARAEAAVPDLDFTPRSWLSQRLGAARAAIRGTPAAPPSTPHR